MLAGERLQGKKHWENITIFIIQKTKNFKQGQNFSFARKGFYRIPNQQKSFLATYGTNSQTQNCSTGEPESQLYNYKCRNKTKDCFY